MSNPANGLASRFEIRRLGPEHIEWAKAVHAHSNAFLSPIWTKANVGLLSWHLHEFFPGFDHVVRHQIESGMSFGIFDTEYKFKNPESAKTGGKLYWETPTTDADRERTTRESLLEQMDFPLVSIALHFDLFYPLDMEKMKPTFSIPPTAPFIDSKIDELDTRDRALAVPSGPGQILQANSTATRDDYTRLGLMRNLADWVTHEAASKGYKSIQLDSFSDAVFRVSTNPPLPYKAEVVCQVNLKEYEGLVEFYGEKFTFGCVDQVVARICVALE
ncbi:hypothetical protein GX50_02808 [[Emmonsia] crescens]|uniref:Uncharacterized protein n=1 Tax=[Emmonsia] crescens TaxID=73230 RepID=A0A2B7ZL20_9EURO|nr:hypothetical protein GX50_02808 [Emmonsia crescens]